MPNTASSFYLPPGMLVHEQIEFCLSVIRRQRQELLPLRGVSQQCHQWHDPLLEQVQEWKEKYQKERTEKEKFQKEVEKLKEEIEKISKTQSRYQVALFDHGNFKHPDNQNKKLSGGQKGHKDTNQDKNRNRPSFVHQRVFAENCGTCGNPLPRVKGVKEKTLIDIQINTQLIQVILESERQWCNNCHKEVTAKSTQSLPFTEYGMNTFMMIMLLRFKSHQSAQKISTVLSLGFGLTLSTSEVLSILKQAKIFLQEKYEQLKIAIRGGAVMYNDETGWQVRGQKAWMWIMTTQDKKQSDGIIESGITVYVAAESRGKGIFEQMYGNSKATSMHDGYTSYASVTGEDKTAYCWAHVLRFAYEETVIEKNPTTIACQIRDRLVTLYQMIRSNPGWSKERKETTLRLELDKLVTLSTTDEASKNIKRRIATQKQGLIKALLITSDGTNNLGERELRPMAIHRTISFGSATFDGMETTAILGSISQTISRNKEQAFLPTLHSYLSAGIQEKYPQYKHPPSFAT